MTPDDLAAFAARILEYVDSEAGEAAEVARFGRRRAERRADAAWFFWLRASGNVPADQVRRMRHRISPRRRAT